VLVGSEGHLRATRAHHWIVGAGAVLGAAIAPAAADGHSLVRRSGTAVTYAAIDATSINTLTVRRSGGDIEFRDPTVDGGADPGNCRPGDTTMDANFWIIQVFCAAGGVRTVRVDLGDREDSVRVSVGLPVGVLGGFGSDTIASGPGKDQLDGGEGDDTIGGAAGDDDIIGGLGADRIDGGAGDDTVRAADGLPDRIACGAGRDRVLADTTDDVAADCEEISRSAVVPPPEAGDALNDRTRPLLDVGALTRQRLGRSFRVRVAATSNERGTIGASGAFDALGIRLPVTSNRRRVTVPGGGVDLTVKLNARQRRLCGRAVRRGRPCTIRLTVAATDFAGNSAAMRAPRIQLVR